MYCIIAGVIIKNEKGGYFVVRRLQEPETLAFPSFHLIDKQNPVITCLDPNLMFRKKLPEELNIKPINIRRLASVIREHKCSVSKTPFITINCHEWIIYEILSYEGNLENKRPQKYDFVGFVSPKRLRKMMKEDRFDSVWKGIINLEDLA